MVFNTLLRGSETLWTRLRIYSTAKVHRFCVISDDMLQSMRLKWSQLISAYRTKRADLYAQSCVLYLMSSVITFVCAWDWSDLLSAVDLTLNLIRNMDDSAKSSRNRERAFNNLVTTHRMLTRQCRSLKSGTNCLPANRWCIRFVRSSSFCPLFISLFS